MACSVFNDDNRLTRTGWLLAALALAGSAAYAAALGYRRYSGVEFTEPEDSDDGATSAEHADADGQPEQPGEE